ncbi:restriction endonuclease subunit S [Campylobacter upsaliensis]|uniref:restriction endonuclease subunit S n=1 Tax=Campylobacter upsaliensis TaxID=28080 RepID=UPI0022EB04C4|nr:restriction endonuclease subunit S [Campylobacter upsaliensis]
MKTDTLKKSLLDYAIKGSLTAKFRRENNGLNAFNEITTYNEAVKEKRKNLEKELKKCEKEFKLEKDKDKKAFLKQEIQTLKKELTKCKEITPLNLSEAPFEIPNSWAWVKLGDICEMKKGPFGSAITKDMFIPNGNNAVKIYEQKNAIQKSETLGEYYISLEHFEKLKQFEVFENDIIVSCAGTIGEIFRIPKNAPKGIINQALMKIKLVNEEWIPYFMIFFDFLIKQKSQENSKGSAIKNIPPLDILKNFSIPLPPLREQQEIVGKLDLLVTLANDFAITKENLKRIEKRIEKSLLKLALEGSLSKLYRRSSPTLCAFDEISTYNDNIKQKRKDLEKKLKICEKELKLEKDKDKKALFKSQIQILKKEIAKCKEITPLNSTDAPFEIPNSWAWVKLGDICEITMGQSPEQNQFIDFSPVSQAQNDKKACHTDLEQSEREVSQHTAFEQLPILDVKYLRGKGDKKLANSGNFVNANDRLILMDGENSGEIFITKEKGFLGSTLKKLEFSSLSQVEFMDFMLLCYKDFFKGNKKGAAIPHLDRKLFTNLSIPLPPLQEQEHITQILDTLFTLKKGLRVD